MKLFLLTLICIAFIAIISCNDAGEGTAEEPRDSAAVAPDSVSTPAPDSTFKVDSANTGDPTSKKFKTGAVKIAADTSKGPKN